MVVCLAHLQKLAQDLGDGSHRRRMSEERLHHFAVVGVWQLSLKTNVHLVGLHQGMLVCGILLKLVDHDLRVAAHRISICQVLSVPGEV
jgi:hypothetical protein